MSTIKEVRSPVVDVVKNSDKIIAAVQMNFRSIKEKASGKYMKAT